MPAWLAEVSKVAAALAFLALCARTSLPLGFTPVPLSLQPFGLLAVGLLLTPRRAATTLVAYLGLGAAGLPVLAPGIAGLAHFLSPTAGYLAAYPLVAVAASVLSRRMGRGYAACLAAAAVAELLLLSSGAVWLAVSLHLPLATAVSLGIVPFLPGDALKIVAAASLVSGWLRLRRQ